MIRYKKWKCTNWNIVMVLFFTMFLASIIRQAPAIIKSVALYALVFLSIGTVLFKRQKFSTNLISGFMGIYSLITVVSLVVNSTTNSSMILASAQFLIVSWSCLLIPERYLKKSIMRFMLFFEKLVLIAVIYSVVLLLFGQTKEINDQKINYLIVPFLGQRKMGLPGSYGYSSFFINPNPFGVFVVWVFAWILATQKLRDYKTILKLAILVVGVQLSASRFAYICLALEIVVYAFCKIRSTKGRKILVLFLCIAIVPAAILWGGTFVQKLMNVDLNGRELIWSGLIDSIKQNLWIGKGYSSGTKVILIGEAGTFGSFITILAENGVIGLCAFFVWFIWMYIKALFIYQKTTEKLNRQYLMFYLMLSAGMFVLGIVENAFMNVTARYLFWLLASRSVLAMEKHK